MTIGDDDTLAGSLPTTTDKVAQAPEIVAERYKIVRWIGGGGMGRVYEALDSELDEHVALKMLRAGLSDGAIERFRREVKLTRRIVHRNVARMFDIGEHGGEKFLTMELVHGEPLTRQIGKPLPWSKLRPIAEQLCAGLAAAHAAGVIHRDLKPDNVLVEQRTERVVITDFGIARGGDDPGVTQEGAVVGTPSYMAPEQLAGKDIDVRADLFALGVMLFELATGMRPWPGDNAIAIAVAQATTAPRTLESTADDVPPAFAHIVAACLHLEADHRPATAELVGRAIATGDTSVLDADKPATRALRPSQPRMATAPPMAVTPHADATSIAVVPIQCAPGDEYLADGLLEDLTDVLSTSSGLRVRPAGIARAQAAADPRELGQKLAVDLVAVSSLRRVPAGLRIAVRLIGVADGFQIWAHKLECPEAEVLAAAEQLARGIASALSTRATSQGTRPTDPRAVELFLRARAELRRFWGAHAQAAADLLAKAAEYAPTSAPILGALAHAATLAWVFRGLPEQRAYAEQQIARALATGHGDAYLASAQYHLNTSEPERAARELASAMVRAPMSAHVHELAGRLLVEIGGPTEARYHFDTALGLDPNRSPVITGELARLEALQGDWERADARVQALVSDPDPAIAQLGAIYETRLAGWRYDTAKMIVGFGKFMRRLGDSALQVLQDIAASAGNGTIDQMRWQAALDLFRSGVFPARSQLMGLQVLAEASAAFGDHAHALVALTVAAHDGLLDVQWLDTCPLFVPIRSKRGFLELRTEVASRAARVLAAYRATTP